MEFNNLFKNIYIDVGKEETCKRPHIPLCTSESCSLNASINSNFIALNATYTIQLFSFSFFFSFALLFRFSHDYQHFPSTLQILNIII